MGFIQCPECKEKVNDTEIICPKCGYNIDIYYKLEQEKKAEIMQVEKDRLLNNIMRIAIVVIAIICVGTVINRYVLSQRKVFSSQQQMQAYLKGYWNLSDISNPDEYTVLKFSEDGDGEYFEKTAQINSGERCGAIVYQYNRGYILFNDRKFIVTKEEKVRDSKRKVDLKKGKPSDEFNFEETWKILKILKSDYEVSDEIVTLSYKLLNKTKKTGSGTVILELKDDTGAVVETITDTFSLAEQDRSHKLERVLHEKTTKKIQQVKSCNAYISSWTIY